MCIRHDKPQFDEPMVIQLPRSVFERVDWTDMPYEVHDVGDAIVDWFKLPAPGAHHFDKLRWLLGEPIGDAGRAVVRAVYLDLLLQRSRELQDNGGELRSSWLGWGAAFDDDRIDGDDPGGVDAKWDCLSQIASRCEDPDGCVVVVCERRHVDRVDEQLQDYEDGFCGVFLENALVVNKAEAPVWQWVMADWIKRGEASMLQMSETAELPATCRLERFSDAELLLLGGVFRICLADEYRHLWNSWQWQRLDSFASRFDAYFGAQCSLNCPSAGLADRQEMVVMGQWDRALVVRASRVALATGLLGQRESRILNDSVKRLSS